MTLLEEYIQAFTDSEEGTPPTDRAIGVFENLSPLKQQAVISFIRDEISAEDFVEIMGLWGFDNAPENG